MGIRVSGIGAYVPAKTTIGRNASDMACPAALRCLSQAGVDKDAVDLIIVACATPDRSQPAVACMVQEKLGLSRTRCPAFDVNSLGSGFVFALSVAQGQMLTDAGRYRRVLVIGADSDGAGAVLLTHRDGDDARFHFHLGSDGRGRRHVERQLDTFAMNGSKVWDFAVSTVPETIRVLLAERGLSTADLDLLILHQSNLRMLEAIMAALDVPMAKTVTTLETLGNTAAASIPLTLQKAWDTGRLRPGSRVMLCGFGGGLSWGSALVDW